MTNRERFQAVLRGRPMERMPMVEWASWWPETVKQWRKEGLSPQLDGSALADYWGLDPLLQYWICPMGKGCPRPPEYGAGILEDEEGYEAALPYLYQDASIQKLTE